nr:putative patatin-like phospholipase [uncultured bacterium]
MLPLLVFVALEIAIGWASIGGCAAQPASIQPIATASSAPSESARPRIGLVLSGGGARGLAHVGVLKALEELRIPVDYIAGTSMGAIVGGLYATGMSADELERKLSRIDWTSLFSDRPPREELSQRRKEEDFKYPIPFELGWREGEIGVARGVIEGGALELFLRELTQPVMLVDDFYALPIPFRAVATDLADGQMVVMRRGRLHEAMRASMSVPGAFSPVEIDGQLFGDGGLVRNLPVDIVREMGAQVVIAVNVGTPIAPRSTLTSALAVTRQMINILTEQNVVDSLRSMSARDVLISPDLGGITFMDFQRGAEIAERGYQGAYQAQSLLRFLALGEADYANHIAQRAVIADLPPAKIDFVEFSKSSAVNSEVLRAQIDTGRDGALDLKTLHADIAKLQGRGDLERVDYRLLRRDGRNGLLLDAHEKSWGPNFLRFGLTLSTDFKGDSSFHLRAGHTRSWINALGAEWRNELQIGRDRLFLTEFYQPLSPSQVFFVAPSYTHERRIGDVFDGGLRVAQYERTENRVAVDAGAQLGRWGEARIGYSHGDIKVYPKIGIDLFEQFRYRESGVRMRAVIDRLDSASFPRSGYRAEYEALISRHAFGGDTDYTRHDLRASAATSLGRHTVSVAFGAGGYTGHGTPPIPDYFALGGFQLLSGYREGQLRDFFVGLGRVVYSARVGDMPALGRGVYVGGSFEAGNAWPTREKISLSGLKYGMSVFIAADTIVGPLYFALGRVAGSTGTTGSAGGANAVYLFLGRP